MATATRTDYTRAAQLFHALSDEIRLEVIDLLRDGERCVCELTEALDIAQPRLSWHLRTLKDAGILTDRREGRWVYYALARDTFEEAESVLGVLKPSARRLPTRTSSCC
jgi:ArsR family transcriptional regulator